MKHDHTQTAIAHDILNRSSFNKYVHAAKIITNSPVYINEVLRSQVVHRTNQYTYFSDKPRISVCSLVKVANLLEEHRFCLQGQSVLSKSPPCCLLHPSLAYSPAQEIEALSLRLILTDLHFVESQKIKLIISLSPKTQFSYSEIRKKLAIFLSMPPAMSGFIYL
jgi:hypothetical protein